MTNRELSAVYLEAFKAAGTKGLDTSKCHVIGLDAVASYSANRAFEAVRGELRPPRNGDTPKYGQREHDIVVNAALGKAAHAVLASTKLE